MTRHLFVVGAQRCGTTYLYQVLDQHPDIEMAKPLRPEPKFFLRPDCLTHGIDWYEQLFHDPQATLRGEKSTSYIESAAAAERIARAYPAATIIMILRDPIERAISNYWFTRDNGLEMLPMSQAFLQEASRLNDYDKEQISVSPYAYLQRGRYIDYVTLYERLFAREQIMVLRFESFVGSPTAAANLYRFLGVKVDFRPAVLGQVINASSRPKTELDPDLQSYLEDYFGSANDDLARHLGWPSPIWPH